MYTRSGDRMAEIVEDGSGAKPALTVLPLRFLTRGGCIVRRGQAIRRILFSGNHLRELKSDQTRFGVIR